MPFDKAVLTMGLIRFLLGLINLIGIYFMLRYNTVREALRINGYIGSIGPFVPVLVSVIGVARLAGSLSPIKLPHCSLPQVCLLRNFQIKIVKKTTLTRFMERGA